MGKLVSGRFIRRLVLAAAAAYIGLVVFALLFANTMIFPAPPASYPDSPGIIKFRYNEGGEAVSMVFLNQPLARYLVFYHHGNGEDLQEILPRLQALQALGLAVLAWDYPGYGTSDGRPDGELVLDIASQIWERIPQDYGFPHERVILYGRSVGSGPATHLASRGKAAGLVLESAFTSTFRVVLPANILPWDVFDNLALIRGVQCPVWLLHGTADRTIDFSHSLRLFERASAPKFFTWIEGGGHNDIPTGYPYVYYSSIRRFLEHIDAR